MGNSSKSHKSSKEEANSPVRLLGLPVYSRASLNSFRAISPSYIHVSVPAWELEWAHLVGNSTKCHKSSKDDAGSQTLLPASLACLVNISRMDLPLQAILEICECVQEQELEWVYNASHSTKWLESSLDNTGSWRWLLGSSAHLVIRPRIDVQPQAIPLICTDMRVVQEWSRKWTYLFKQFHWVVQIWKRWHW